MQSFEILATNIELGELLIPYEHPYDRTETDYGIDIIHSGSEEPLIRCFERGDSSDVYRTFGVKDFDSLISLFRFDTSSHPKLLTKYLKQLRAAGVFNIQCRFNKDALLLIYIDTTPSSGSNAYFLNKYNSHMYSCQVFPDIAKKLGNDRWSWGRKNSEK